MTRTVVLGTDDNPIYEYFVPIVTWAWERLGWNVVCRRFDADHHGYRRATLAQVSRLYIDDSIPDDVMVMTSDVDMIPLADYWRPDPAVITAYGHDLTGYRQIPVCYVAMTAARWRELFPGDLFTGLDATPQASSEDWHQWWFTDQAMLTGRLEGRDDLVVLERGVHSSGRAIGRVDRDHWVRPRSVDRVDYHVPRPGYTRIHHRQIVRVLRDAFGDVPDWIDDHARDYRRRYRRTEGFTVGGRPGGAHRYSRSLRRALRHCAMPLLRRHAPSTSRPGTSTQTPDSANRNVL